MSSHQPPPLHDNSPYLLYYVNAMIENENIIKEQNEYIEKLKNKLTLMKKLKEVNNNVSDLLKIIHSTENIIDKNASTIKSIEREIQDINTKIPY